MLLMGGHSTEPDPAYTSQSHHLNCVLDSAPLVQGTARNLRYLTVQLRIQVIFFYYHKCFRCSKYTKVAFDWNLGLIKTDTTDQ